VPAGTAVTVSTADAVAAWLRPEDGTGELVAARVTRTRDANGPLLTGGPLQPAPLRQQLPAVVPGR
jgi:hypothetical protein